MTREFFRKVLAMGKYSTRKHEYKVIRHNGLVKIIRDNSIIVAVY